MKSTLINAPVQAVENAAVSDSLRRENEGSGL